MVHIHADFGDEMRGGHRCDPRVGRAQGDSVLIGTNRLVDLRIQLRALGFQTFQWLLQHAQYPAMVVGHAPLERKLPLWKRGREATAGELGESGGVRFAGQELRPYGPLGDT
jgi:hypothetical protein